MERLISSMYLVASYEVGVFVFGFIFLAVGLFNIFFTKKIYRLKERWQHKESGEPSTLFMFTTKITGGVIALAGVSFLILPFLY